MPRGSDPEGTGLEGPPGPPPALARAATAKVLHTGLEQLVRRNLRGVWVRGEWPAPGPVVWLANHHSWWDYFVAASALRSAGRAEVGVLMDPASIGSRSFYLRVGAVGTDRLRTAVELLRSGQVLVVFPEGRLLPAGPLGEPHPGAAWLARRSGAVILPVATRVVLRGQQAAEAYLDLGPPADPDSACDDLRERLAGLDAELAHSDPDVALPGFRQVVSGVRSWPERFQRRPATG